VLGPLAIGAAAQTGSGRRRRRAHRADNLAAVVTPERLALSAMMAP